jgi:hypothetical protein
VEPGLVSGDQFFEGSTISRLAANYQDIPVEPIRNVGHPFAVNNRRSQLYERGAPAERKVQQKSKGLDSIRSGLGGSYFCSKKFIPRKILIETQPQPLYLIQLQVYIFGKIVPRPR